MKLSDYVADFIARQGVRHVFLVSGGAVVHLVDSVARHPELSVICSQHEEAAAMGADGYSRTSRNLGVAMATSGPGATNLVTGVACAYFDSIPTLYITGQVARFRLKKNDKLRQKGFQETDVVSIFKSITKYAVLADDPLRIRYELEKAIYVARSGRPGPVLLDIPDDVQRVEINPDELQAYLPEPHRLQNKPFIDNLQRLLSESRRPVLIYGAGIRLAKAEKEALAFAERLQIPVLFSWGGLDLMPYDHPLNAGGLGVVGPRGGNFTVQRSDLILAVGTRLSQMIIGGKQELFAPSAKKIVVDIDPEEFQKFPSAGITVDLEIQSGIKEFFEEMREKGPGPILSDALIPWLEFAQAMKKEFPVCLDENRNRKNSVDAIVFVEELSKQALPNDVIVADTGANVAWTMQAFRVKAGQKIFSAWNHSPMGYALPASIGAAFAKSGNVLCLIGDGGLMMCLQEIATAARHNLPIKLFIFNNHGHGIQKQTLDTWLDSRYVGVNEPTGLSFPNFLTIGEAFGIKTVPIRNNAELAERIKDVLRHPGPVLCNVEIFPEQRIVPMLKFGGSLADLDPKLSSVEINVVENAIERLSIPSKHEETFA